MKRKRTLLSNLQLELMQRGFRNSVWLPERVETNFGEFEFGVEQRYDSFVDIFAKVMAENRDFQAGMTKEEFKQVLKLERMDIATILPRKMKRVLNFPVIEKEKRNEIWKDVCNGVPEHYVHWKSFHVQTQNSMQRISKSLLKDLSSSIQKEAKKVESRRIILARRLHREMKAYYRGEIIEEPVEEPVVETIAEVKSPKPQKKKKSKSEIVKEKRRIARMEREKLKKQQEEDEKARNERKLNFLLTQTELYSHFMSGKLSKEELEDSSLLPPNSEPDDVLTAERAKENAQRAFQTQRDHAQQFDNETSKFREPDLGLKGDDAVTSEGKLLQEPVGFQGKLKEYQKVGLTWLAKLYDQGINGILADDMGLGKTVQTIAFLSHLAVERGVWGPFVIIAPTSTLHHWQHEVEEFCPQLRALPYWGGPKGRKILRGYWDEDHLYKKDSTFHVLITSYGVLMEDIKLFKRIRWQYLILDEAHWIKSAKSNRWKKLLAFKCRNRLLLTGTPIQNNMAELWALLHFIMPTLFDNHDDFATWFSKDIEKQAGSSNSSFNMQQLERLHIILKPFMLRRIKQDVEKELPQKIEKIIYCGMNKTQQLINTELRKKILDGKAIFENVGTSTRKTLQNLLMQFRKLCNHPQLFEMDDVASSLRFQMPINFSVNVPKSISGSYPEVHCNPQDNPITFHIPKRLYRQGGMSIALNSKGYQGDVSGIYRKKIIDRYFNIYSAENIHHSLFPEKKEFKPFQPTISNSAFSWSRFCDLSPSEISYIFEGTNLQRIIFLLNSKKRLERLKHISTFGEQDSRHMLNQAKFLIDELTNFTQPHHQASLDEDSSLCWHDLFFTNDPVSILSDSKSLFKKIRCFRENAKAAPISIHCSDRSFMYDHQEQLFHPWYKYWFLGHSTVTSIARYPLLYFAEQGEWYTRVVPRIEDAPYRPPQIDGLFSPYLQYENDVGPPSVSRLIGQSGKLKVFDSLLMQLKKENHRVLVFSQMTKMLDLLESYLYGRQYKFLRLDGSTPVNERRDMVNSFQTDPSIFCFLLSTRAGGLGINLTAADTVVFYDLDFNPTQDAQAMDRCHRIGQDKVVTVYRIVTKGSVEERMLQIAQRKMKIQSSVYRGEFKEKFEDEEDDADENELNEALFGDELLEGHKEEIIARAKKADQEMAQKKKTQDGVPEQKPTRTTAKKKKTKVSGTKRKRKTKELKPRKRTKKNN